MHINKYLATKKMRRCMYTDLEYIPQKYYEKNKSILYSII